MQMACSVSMLIVEILLVTDGRFFGVCAGNSVQEQRKSSSAMRFLILKKTKALPQLPDEIMEARGKIWPSHDRPHLSKDSQAFQERIGTSSPDLQDSCRTSGVLHASSNAIGQSWWSGARTRHQVRLLIFRS